MNEVKIEARSGTAIKADLGRQVRPISSNHKNSCLPGTDKRSSLEEGADVGASGDRSCDLERCMASSLSSDLLHALNAAPTHRTGPDYERTKVACLKSAILDLQKENDALCWELWRTKRSQEESQRSCPEGFVPQSVEPGISHIAVPHMPPARDTERKPSIQLCQGPKTQERRTKPTHHPDMMPIGAGRGPIPSSHSKCADWLGHNKPTDKKADQFYVVRLALWQLWELADRALTRTGHYSSGSCYSQQPEEVTDDDGSNYFEKETHSQIGPSNSVEVERLKSQLAYLQRSNEHMRRRRDEQALLLQQREMQVTRLQRSRTHLSHSFKAQLKLLRKQQVLELKALQLKMQTEHASSLAGQSAEMGEQLQGAVEQLEERYRTLLKGVINGTHKESIPSAQLGSAPSRHSKGESGT